MSTSRLHSADTNIPSLEVVRDALSRSVLNSPERLLIDGRISGDFSALDILKLCKERFDSLSNYCVYVDGLEGKSRVVPSSLHVPRCECYGHVLSVPGDVVRPLVSASRKLLSYDRLQLNLNSESAAIESYSKVRQ